MRRPWREVLCRWRGKHQFTVPRVVDAEGKEIRPELELPTCVRCGASKKDTVKQRE